MNLKQENGKFLFPELFPLMVDYEWTKVYDNRYSMMDLLGDPTPQP